MGLSWSEDKEVVLRRLDVQMAELDAKMKMAELDAKVAIAAIQQNHYGGLKWIREWFGIAHPISQMVAISAFLGGMRFGYDKLIHAMNIDLFLKATTEDAKQVYSERAGYRDLKAVVSVDTARLRVMGYFGLVGVPVATLAYLVVYNAMMSVDNHDYSKKQRGGFVIMAKQGQREKEEGKKD